MERVYNETRKHLSRFLRNLLSVVLPHEAHQSLRILPLLRYVDFFHVAIIRDFFPVPFIDIFFSILPLFNNKSFAILGLVALMYAVNQFEI